MKSLRQIIKEELDLFDTTWMDEIPARKEGPITTKNFHEVKPGDKILFYEPFLHPSPFKSTVVTATPNYLIIHFDEDIEGLGHNGLDEPECGDHKCWGITIEHIKHKKVTLKYN